jgi:hypothetical protein
METRDRAILGCAFVEINRGEAFAFYTGFNDFHAKTSATPVASQTLTASGAAVEGVH